MRNNSTHSLNRDSDFIPTFNSASWLQVVGKSLTGVRLTSDRWLSTGHRSAPTFSAPLRSTPQGKMGPPPLLIWRLVLLFHLTIFPTLLPAFPLDYNYFQILSSLKSKQKISNYLCLPVAAYILLSSPLHPSFLKEVCLPSSPFLTSYLLLKLCN